MCRLSNGISAIGDKTETIVRNQQKNTHPLDIYSGESSNSAILCLIFMLFFAFGLSLIVEFLTKYEKNQRISSQNTAKIEKKNYTQIYLSKRSKSNTNLF